MAKVMAEPRSEEVTGYPGYDELEALVAQRARGRKVMIWSGVAVSQHVDGAGSLLGPSDGESGATLSRALGADRR